MDVDQPTQTEEQPEPAQAATNGHVEPEEDPDMDGSITCYFGLGHPEAREGLTDEDAEPTLIKMETYNGHVRTPNDAIILFEACRLGLLPRVQRRLSEKERQSIRSGSVFVWDEREAGMRRWTDGKSWSASRVSGSFLTYREMEGKRGGNSFPPANNANRGNKTPDSGRNSLDDAMDGEEGPDGYRYKPDGLMKQSFSLTTSTGQHLHLISYFSRSHPTAHPLRQPSNDPSLSTIQIPKGMYPESTVIDASNTPAVTRSPMPGAPNYVMAAGGPFGRPQPAPPPGFIPGYPPYGGYMYPGLPMSPMHTPPGAYPMHYAPYPYYHPAAYGHPPPPPHHMPQLQMSGAPPSHYDQRPLRHSGSAPKSPPRPSLVPTTSSSYSQEKPGTMPPVSQPYPITPGSERAPSIQLDPKLGENGLPNPIPPPQNTETQSQPETSRPDLSHSSAAAQAPSITSLVNAAAQALPLPSRNREGDDRQGSTSPGGSRYEAAPRDIPSEKLGFREDKNVLSKLDRHFARV